MRAATSLESNGGGSPEKIADLEAWIRAVERKQTSGGFPGASTRFGDSDSGAEFSPAQKHARMENIGRWFLGAMKGNTEMRERAEASFGVSKALGGDIGSEGGYLVPRPLAAEILRLAAPVAAVRPISKVVPMIAKTLDLPDVATAPSVSLTDESAVIPESAPTFKLLTLVAKKIAARAKASMEVFDDSLTQIASMMLQLFAEAIVKMEDAQALEGDGIGANFSGLLFADNVADVPVGAALTGLDPFIDATEALSFAAQMDESR